MGNRLVSVGERSREFLGDNQTLKSLNVDCRMSDIENFPCQWSDKQGECPEDCGHVIKQH